MTVDPIISNLLFLLAGAAIAALSGLMLRSRGSGAGTDREQVARRLALMEEVALHLGSVHYTFQKYWSLMQESYRYRENWPKARREELEEVTRELVSAFDDLALAEAKLLLLGEKSLTRGLRIYTGKVAHFRKSYYVGKSGVTEEELSESRREISAIRDRFLDSLSTRYARKPD